MIDAERAKVERFGGGKPVNPVACQTCKFMTHKYGVNCLVYSREIGMDKPESVYNYGQPCEYYSKKV